MNQRSARLGEVVGRWIRSAQDDRDAMRVLSAEGPPRVVGFHAQQAVEKLLKAVLISYDVQPQDTHDVGALVGQVHRLDRRLAESLGAVARLTRFAVRLRYPPAHDGAEAEITDAEARADAALSREACAKLDGALDARLRTLDANAE